MTPTPAPTDAPPPAPARPGWTQDAGGWRYAPTAGGPVVGTVRYNQAMEAWIASVKAAVPGVTVPAAEFFDNFAPAQTWVERTVAGV